MPMVTRLGVFDVKVLVTGSTGFLGNHVVTTLRAEGHDVSCLERTDGDNTILWSEGSQLPRIDFQIDLLIHLAWDINHRSDWDVQLRQLERTSQLCKLLPQTKKVIGLGSSEEYGRRIGKLSESGIPTCPLSAYGWSKRSAGDLLRSRAAESGVPAVWLRAFTIYGEGQRGNMLIPYAIRQAIAGETAEFSEGKQKRDFVHVSDVVNAIRLAAEQDVQGQTAFNVGTGVATPVRDVITTIADHFGTRDLFLLGARPTGTNVPELQLADLTNIQANLGYQPRVLLEEGLARTLAHATAESA